jgi:hypothetical protein
LPFAEDYLSIGPQRSDKRKNKTEKEMSTTGYMAGVSLFKTAIWKL